MAHEVQPEELISAEPEWDQFASPKMTVSRADGFSGMNGLQFDPHMCVLL